MSNEEQRLLEACLDDATQIFTIIKQGYYDVVDMLIEENKINVNLKITIKMQLK